MVEDEGGQDGGRGEADKDRLIAELREAVRARDEFVAIAAHELRNPMTPILMQVHTLLAQALQEGLAVIDFKGHAASIGESDGEVGHNQMSLVQSPPG